MGRYRAPRGDREYRRREDAGETKEGAGAEYRPVSSLRVEEVMADLISASVVSVVVPVLPLRKAIDLCHMNLYMRNVQCSSVPNTSQVYPIFAVLIQRRALWSLCVAC